MPPSHISTIIDLSPQHSIHSFLPHILAFLNAHLASSHQNTLAVFAALPAHSLILYSSTHPPTPHPNPNSFPAFKSLDAALVNNIQAQLDAIPHPTLPTALVPALTKALCYINRISHDANALPNPRILILSVSPDLSTSYIPIMNSIFSAQKLKVTIDVCKLFGSDSVFLQQAAHLTGGSYIAPHHPDALLQYLIMSFLPSPDIRRILAVPTQDKIDFRAACFCHKHIVDIGFVCSVCLSIFCQPVPVCSTCRTKFPIKTLQRLNAARPSLPITASQPPPPSQNTVNGGTSKNGAVT